MKRILVTGFGHFPGAPVNPTGDIVRAVSRMRFGNVVVIPHLFRTVYAEVAHDLPRLIAAHRPDILLMFGLAGRAGAIRIEAVARNQTHRRVPDADGKRFASLAIARQDKAHRRTGIHAGRLAAFLRHQGLAAVRSGNAGTYLCNFSYFLALQAKEEGLVREALFVHVPLPSTGKRPSAAFRTPRMSRHDLARAARLITAALPRPVFKR